MTKRSEIVKILKKYPKYSRPTKYWKIFTTKELEETLKSVRRIFKRKYEK